MSAPAGTCQLSVNTWSRVPVTHLHVSGLGGVRDQERVLAEVGGGSEGDTVGGQLVLAPATVGHTVTQRGQGDALAWTQRSAWSSKEHYPLTCHLLASVEAGGVADEARVAAPAGVRAAAGRRGLVLHVGAVRRAVTHPRGRGEAQPPRAGGAGGRLVRHVATLRHSVAPLKRGY